jgi:putative redox protein
MPTRSTLRATFLDPIAGMGVEVGTPSGFTLRFDTASRDEGGTGSGPTETLLGALAACTAMDVASILRKKRQRFHAYEIVVTADKAEAHPQTFTAITVEHRLAGEVTAEAVRRSVELSATTYCPVSAMLSASVRIEHRYRIRRGAEPADQSPNGPSQEESGLVVVTGPDGTRAAGRTATG